MVRHIFSSSQPTQYSLYLKRYRQEHFLTSFNCITHIGDAISLSWLAVFDESPFDPY
jgi:hypothetical protein